MHLGHHHDVPGLVRLAQRPQPRRQLVAEDEDQPHHSTRLSRPVEEAAAVLRAQPVEDPKEVPGRLLRRHRPMPARIGGGEGRLDRAGMQRDAGHATCGCGQARSPRRGPACSPPPSRRGRLCQPPIRLSPIEPTRAVSTPTLPRPCAVKQARHLPQHQPDADRVDGDTSAIAARRSAPAPSPARAPPARGCRTSGRSDRTDPSSAPDTRRLRPDRGRRARRRTATAP